MLVRACVVCISLVLWCTRAEATPPASLPVGVERALRAACGDGVTSVAGPWSRGDDRHWAGLVWSAGSPYACLAMLRVTHEAPILEARGRIPAGYSVRDDQFFAPQLRAEPMMLADHGPAVVTDAGDRTIIWLARAGRWTSTYDAVLNAHSDVHDGDGSQCPASPPLEVRTSRDGRVELQTRSCFDGRFYRARLRFDGHRFVP